MFHFFYKNGLTLFKTIESNRSVATMNQCNSAGKSDIDSPPPHNLEPVWLGSFSSGKEYDYESIGSILEVANL